MENNLDMMFFAKQANKGLTNDQIMASMKLNKGEKRALKFAIKNGTDLTEIDDLPAFMAELMGHKKAQ